MLETFFETRGKLDAICCILDSVALSADPKAGSWSVCLNAGFSKGVCGLEQLKDLSRIHGIQLSVPKIEN